MSLLKKAEGPGRNCPGPPRSASPLKSDKLLFSVRFGGQCARSREGCDPRHNSRMNHIACTCARVPVFRSHSESIQLVFDEEVDAAEARELLRDAPGVKLVDDPVQDRKSVV